MQAFDIQAVFSLGIEPLALSAVLDRKVADSVRDAESKLSRSRKTKRKFERG
jgi:hypothetical protein